MLDAFYISAIGLQAQKAQLDAMASNLANISTTAFKRQSVDFSAFLDRAQAPADRGTQLRPDRLLHVDQSPGEVHETGRALDIAIVGAGFLEVTLPGEVTGYSRAGSLQVGEDGVLTLSSGHALTADVRVPSDARDVQILPDGSVVATLAGDRDPTLLGQIELATFANPELLEYRGEGVFVAPEGIEPLRSRPAADGAGEIRVRSLEGSNVNMTDEMVSLLLMQRIYELNSRVAQVADELMSLSNNLRRG